jgi:hypothetical protein
MEEKAVRNIGAQISGSILQAGQDMHSDCIKMHEAQQTPRRLSPRFINKATTTIQRVQEPSTKDNRKKKVCLGNSTGYAQTERKADTALAQRARARQRPDCKDV